MKNTILLIIFLPIVALSQTKAPAKKPATTSAPAATKKILQTIPEDEYVDSDNTKIIPTATGADCRVVTYDDNQKYYKYIGAGKKEPFAIDIWEDDVIISGKENGLKYFKAKATGQKYGPYPEIQARYDQTKKVLYGYSYYENDKSYFVDLINNKNYGPFEGGGVWFVDDKNLVYSYAETTPTGKQVYLVENGNKLGPFEQVVYRRPELGKASPIIVTKKDNKFYVNQDPWKSTAFATYPSMLTEMPTGWAIESTEVAGSKDKWIYLPNGKKVENNEKLKHAFNSKGQVLKLEFAGGGGSDAAYKVTFDGKEIGLFALRKSTRSDLINSDIFDHQLMKVDLKNNYALAYRDVNFYFSASRGLVGPFTEKDLPKIHFIKDGYAAIKADSTLEINGKRTLDDVIAVDFSGYPETWFALQQRGDYAIPFKNGVEATLADIPEKYRFFHTQDKPLVKVKRKNNTYFLRVTATGKLLGPVSEYNESITSKDMKHFITVMDETENIIADGKVVGKAGFNLTYNDKLHAFHWLTQSGQQLNLHTYKLPK